MPHPNTTIGKCTDLIVKTYDVLYNKVFVLKNTNEVKELMCTYNIEAFQNTPTLPDTISLHRKKQTNTLYTINALNECIKTCNNGVLDTTFQVDWENYRNCIMVTNEDGLRRIDTSVKEIIQFARLS